MATDQTSPRHKKEQAAGQAGTIDTEGRKNAGVEREEFMSGSSGITGQGRSDIGKADSSYPTVEGQDDRSMEYQGGAKGSTGPSGTSDAGGGTGTIGGLTGGVGGTALGDDEQRDKTINRERRETSGGEVSQRDNNIKTG